MQSLPFRPYSNYDANFQVIGVRAIYDLVFFIIITVLGLNIVIAILVDRFSDLREDRVCSHIHTSICTSQYKCQS